MKLKGKYEMEREVRNGKGSMKLKGNYKKPALPSQIEGRMVLELKRGTLLPSTIFQARNCHC